MPINLTQIDPSLKPVKITPKFFHRDFTGTGGSTGMFTSQLDTFDQIQKADQNHLRNGFMTSQTRVLSFMTPDEVLGLAPTRGSQSLCQSLGYHNNIAKVSTKQMPTSFFGNDHFAFNLTSNHAKLNTLNQQAINQLFGDFKVDWNINPQTNERESVIITSITHYRWQNIYNKKRYVNWYTINFSRIIITPDKQNQSAKLLFDNTPLTNSQLLQLPIHRLLTHQAQLIIDGHLKWLTPLFKISDDLDILNRILAYNNALITLDKRNLTSHDYQQAYQSLSDYLIQQKHWSVTDFEQLISANTRLSLSSKISKLENNAHVHQFKPQNAFQTTEKYSKEQLALIKTTKPYVVGVAGAGSGKSHTLLGRLDYLVQNNVDLHKVLMLSFTNTAADNITNRYHNGINSLTFADLVNQIYNCNYQHHLVDPMTLLNTLYLLNDRSNIKKQSPTMDDTLHQLIGILRGVRPRYQKTKPETIIQAYTTLLSTRFDDVIKILDNTRETTLGLQPIVLYIMMLKQIAIKEPKFFQHLDFIITDESQDISSFEYVLLLEIAAQKNAQLMIMGDANQTLYEFRDSNPEFMNTLEDSDVFTSYEMSTNYRSNQDILVMANQILSVLQTNQHAQLQLHANQYSTVSEQSFKDRVHIANILADPQAKSYQTSGNQTTIGHTLYTNPVVKKYLSDRLKNHEQVALMAFSNRDANSLEIGIRKLCQALRLKNPDIVRIIPKRRKPSELLSLMFTQAHDLYFDNRIEKKQSITYANLRQTIINRYRSLTINMKYPDKWSQQALNDFIKRPDLQGQIARYNRTRNANNFIGWIAMHLIQLESRHNQTASLIRNDANPANYRNADVVISTIHSAKGLEFPHVVCYFDETSSHYNGGVPQSTLRLYGVALTRAQESELIINTVPNISHTTNGQAISPYKNFDVDDAAMFETPMRSAYQRVLNQLKQKP